MTDSQSRTKSGLVAHARRILVLVMGGTVIAIGMALLILPGPGIVIIVAGLGILGLEFAWARHWLRRARELLPSSRAKDAGKHS